MIKRKDNRGRNLNNGESQRKDGRYAYKYKDTYGKQKFIYSWRLVETDPTPKGKKHDLSLREKEKQVMKDITDGIDIQGQEMTVNELVEKYLSHKVNAKHYTKRNHETIKKIVSRHEFGKMKIKNVKPSTAKEFIITLYNEGMVFNTIKGIIAIVRPAFDMAVNDDLIRKNPFKFRLSEIIKDTSPKREALTEDEEKKILDFIKNDRVLKKYYDEVIILLRTGMRASELCGLVIEDLDFEERKINVSRQLMRDNKDTYLIVTPKTDSGIRSIPMSKEVYEAFQNIIGKGKKSKIEVDGYKNFVFIANGGRPKAYTHYKEMFKNIRKRYKKTYGEEIKLTAHVLRHTFCTRMANAGCNVKSLQYVLGHSEVTTTLGIYAHASYDNVLSEFSRIYEV